MEKGIFARREYTIIKKLLVLTPKSAKNPLTPVRLEPAASQSRIKHSTTEPLRSRLPGLSQTTEIGATLHCNGSLRNFFQSVL